MLRLLAFNVLLVFLPATGILYLDTYEEKLLEAQERSMVQQGRVLAAALASPDGLDSTRARAILNQVEQRFTARLRVLDRDGLLVADSARLGPRREAPTVAGAAGSRELAGAESGQGQESEPETDPRSNLLYRAGALVVRAGHSLLDRLGLSRPTYHGSGRDLYDPAAPFEGPEVGAALGGRYGAVTRPSPGQRSVTLYCAIPVRGGAGLGDVPGGGEVVGAVLVSQSTLRLLSDLYETRLAIVRVVALSLLVAGVLSLMVSTTIVRPLAELRRQAAELVDRRGRLRGRFRGSRRRDEIGDLARALEELSRRLGEHLSFIESFAGDVSHEFKNPLAAIRSATQMLAEVEAPDERRRFLRVVEREVARMERLLSGVREVSELDSALEGESRGPIVLGDILGGVVAGWQARGPLGVEVRSAMPEGEVRVLASADRLVQIFDNLLDNALSFAPPASAVEVSLTVEAAAGAPGPLPGGPVHHPGGRFAVVLVGDRGQGIPPEHLQRIFDRFFTWRPGQPAAKSHHSGLGLAIVKAIAEGYGGTVAAGNRPGGGAVFTVRLPLA